MTAINRVKRSLFRAGELQECLTPTCSQGFEVPAVEVLGAQDGAQDGFDASSEGVGGADAPGKRRPVELNPLDRPLSNADFQQNLQQPLEGASPRAQQVNQAESPYPLYWKDEQDFSVRKDEGPDLTVPEPPRSEAARPEFQDVEDVSELEPVQQASRASAAELESRRFAEVAEPPFSLLGRAELRA